MLRATTKLNVLRSPLLRRSLSSSADAPVLREVRGAVGLLTLNRPKALNALSPDLGLGGLGLELPPRDFLFQCELTL